MKENKKAFEQYVQARLFYLDEWKLEQLAGIINRKALNGELGIYVSEQSSTIEGFNRRLDFETTDYTKLRDEIKNMIESIFATVENYNVWRSMHNAISYFHLGADGKWKTYKMEYFEDEFLYMLRWMIFGVVDNDLRIVHELQEKYGFTNNVWKGTTIWGKWFTFEELNNIKVKFYKNGRIDIEGLTEENIAAYKFIKQFSGRSY